MFVIFVCFKKLNKKIKTVKKVRNIYSITTFRWKQKPVCLYHSIILQHKKLGIKSLQYTVTQKTCIYTLVMYITELQLVMPAQLAWMVSLRCPRA